jgi:hypothetical protein
VAEGGDLHLRADALGYGPEFADLVYELMSLAQLLVQKDLRGLHIRWIGICAICP